MACAWLVCTKRPAFSLSACKVVHAQNNYVKIIERLAVSKTTSLSTLKRLSCNRVDARLIVGIVTWAGKANSARKEFQKFFSIFSTSILYIFLFLKTITFQGYYELAPGREGDKNLTENKGSALALT